MNDVSKPFIVAVAERLVEQLKEGIAPWQKPWTAGEGGLPTNPVTGKRYKGINALHLMSQDHTDQRWMTYKQAQSIGAQVRPGEKGTPIQYWKFSEERASTDANDQPILDADGKVVSQTIRLERPSLFMATVFNAGQIDGLPPAQWHKPQQWNPVDRAEKMLKSSGATLQHSDQDRAFYRPSTDTIHLPEKQQFASADRYYATALHELGHWTGHATRLDRDMAHPFGSEGYAREELRAEIASMILGDELGIGHDPRQHAAYVGSWIKAIKEDPLEIFRAAADAEKIQGYLLDLEQKQVQQQASEDQQGREAQQVADFVAANQGLLPEKVARNTLSADPMLKATLADEAKMASLNDRVNALLRGINQVYVDETQVVIAATLGRPDAEQLAQHASRARAEMPADPSEVQLLADFAAANQGLYAAKVAEHVREAAPALQALLREESKMALLAPQVGELLRGIDQRYVEQTFATAIEALAREVPMVLTRQEQAVVEALVLARSDDTSAEQQSWRAVNEAAQIAYGLKLPIGWTGYVQTARDELNENDGDEFWGVTARGSEGFEFWIADAGTEQEAKKLADRLKLIDAHADSDEFQKAVKLAQVRENAVRRDPYSTTEDINTATEARRHAQLKVMWNDADLQRRIAEQERIQREGVPDAAQSMTVKAIEHTYLPIWFEDKEQAKALGVKLDTRKKAWCIPSGGDLSPFKAQQGTAFEASPEVAAVSRLTAVPVAGDARAEERRYLAVPYDERKAAKAAGASWDTSAHAWRAEAGADMIMLARWMSESDRTQQAPAMNPRAEFADALRQAGCVVSGEHPVMDGQRHRIPVQGEQGRAASGSGLYVAQLEGHPSGYVKNEQTGEELQWKAKGYSFGPAKQAALGAEAAIRRQQRSAELSHVQQQAAERVTKQVASLVAPSSPTLFMQARKLELQPGLLTDEEGRKTCIPMLDASGKLWNMQTLSEDGTSQFEKGGRKQGCFHVVGGLDALAKVEVLVIAEEYATSSSLSQSLGFATVAAFDSDNLPHVARALHRRFPDKAIIIAGDNDQHVEAATGINPGKTKAQEAARATGGRVVLPVFGPGEQVANPEGFTNFNDLAVKSVLGRDGLDRQARTVVVETVEQYKAIAHQRIQEQLQKHGQRHTTKIA